MADERTEKPTAKRLQKARGDGQVSKSQDLNSAVTLTIGLAVLFFYTPKIIERFKIISINLLKNLNPHLVDKENLYAFVGKYILEMVHILVPIMSIMLIAGVAINRLQVGPLFTLKAIKPDISKLSPQKVIMGFKKYFELKSLVELVKSLIKIVIIGGVGYGVIMGHKLELMALLGVPPQVGMQVLANVTLDLVIKICIILIVLGIIDKKYQDYEYEKSLKMTKQDVKDERKNAEGDPKIKAYLRKQQNKFAMQRMMSAVPTADVVVTNPTHYAIAIRYDINHAPAPQVVAKGVDYVAFKIREIAEANKVPVVENPPLARTLHKIVPLDGMVPAELYVAVAEVLAFVYKANNKR